MATNQLQLQGRVSSAAAAYLIQDENLQNSDLQPGKYEGDFVTYAIFLKPEDQLAAYSILNVFRCRRLQALGVCSGFGTIPLQGVQP